MYYPKSAHHLNMAHPRHKISQGQPSSKPETPLPIALNENVSSAQDSYACFKFAADKDVEYEEKDWCV